MKYLLCVLFVGLGCKLYSQDLSDYENNKVRLVDSGIVVQANIEPYRSAPKIKDKVFYYWYSANHIHATQGGFSGQLLNGNYSAFYPNKNLKEQGNFKIGLKEGVWKSWNAKGELISVTHWDHGVEINNPTRPFWKKLNPFIKKAQITNSKSN